MIEHLGTFSVCRLPISFSCMESSVNADLPWDTSNDSEDSESPALPELATIATRPALRRASLVASARGRRGAGDKSAAGRARWWNSDKDKGGRPIMWRASGMRGCLTLLEITDL